MSNEELVAAIQAGEDRMEELWEQVCGLVKWKANHIMTVLTLRGSSCGVEFDDLFNSGYLALVKAVETYNAEVSGAFSTWLMFYLRSAFAVTAGYQTKKSQNEPLNNALSLDTPLSDDSDSSTMMEIVEDPNSQKPMQDMEESVFQKQLHEAMEAALTALPKQNAEVLRLRHYQGLTYATIGQIQETTPERIRQMETKAIRELRRPRYACHLRPFYEFDYYCGTGLGAFQHTGMSIQERYLVLEEEAQERENRRRQERESTRQKEKIQNQVRDTIDRINQEAQEKVARMTPEEKRALLEKYGYA